MTFWLRGLPIPVLPDGQLLQVTATGLAVPGQKPPDAEERGPDEADK